MVYVTLVMPVRHGEYFFVLASLPNLARHRTPTMNLNLSSRT